MNINRAAAIDRIFSCQDAGTARVHFSEKTETMMYLGWLANLAALFIERAATWTVWPV
jgi:hypothetical protein